MVKQATNNVRTSYFKIMLEQASYNVMNISYFRCKLPASLKHTQAFKNR